MEEQVKIEKGSDLEKSINDQLIILDNLQKPLHEYIKTKLPYGSFRTNCAWGRLQECVNWATSAIIEQQVQDKKKSTKE